MLLWVGLQADALSGMKRDSSGLKPDPRLAGRFTHVRPVWHNRAPRGVAQPGSALEWGSRSRQFKSDHPDHSLPLSLQRGPRLMPVLHLALASRIGFQKPSEETGGAQTNVLKSSWKGVFVS